MSSLWSQPFTDDMAVFNRWLCVSRMRTAVAVAVFFPLVAWLHLVALNGLVVLALCAALVAYSLLGLRSPWLTAHPRCFFWMQLVVDLGAITLGIGLAARGEAALLARPLYAIAIVPASLLSVPFGLATATLSTLGHGFLLASERGFTLATLCSFDFLAPTFLFFLVAQQSFVYGAHLREKSVKLAGLAQSLEVSQARLAEEGRLAAGIAEIGRTLSASLDDPEPLSRVVGTIRERLWADWCALFSVDEASFRLLAVCEPESGASNVTGIDLPLGTWPAIERVRDARILALGGNELMALPSSLSGRTLRSTLLTGLYRDHVMVGLIAVGHATPLGASEPWARNLLAGIAEHASVVLQNARLLEEVRTASALKSEFVGAVSHELRSPLNIVLGYLEMLLDEALGPLTDAQRDALRRTDLQASTLLEMIEALLDLNRIDAGKLPVESVPVSLPDLLRDVCEPMQRNVARPGVELRWETEPSIDRIETDPGKLKTIVRNLVHNALKFTEHGEVRVSASITSDGVVEIVVSDTGCGMPPEALGYVFEMFRQIPGSSGGGVGLGLHIVRRLAEVLGAHVTVDSTPGRGSRFSVVLKGGGETSDAVGTVAA
ncbi:HAMP domain-containing histidine kinase [Candidatus Binatia bacterium]|jgi:signal transduction histidine kinase|nr:HAMP domain-containing histidine kinase [Candidatus Binatia bacterium]